VQYGIRAQTGGRSATRGKNAGYSVKKNTLADGDLSEGGSDDELGGISERRRNFK